MAKPGGPGCNLACAYCYYLPKAGMFSPQAPGPMSEELLGSFIRQRLELSPGPVTHFEWHGGEPTLLGLDYFRRIVALQRTHCPPGRTISNGLQTNGTLLDDAWGRFLRREGFSVGLSLDGPAACHDAHRQSSAGKTTHRLVIRTLQLLQRHGVHCDVLCVLHAGNSSTPLPVYHYFRDLGITHLQFLPLVEPGGRRLGATAEAIGDFLCRVFDDWIRHDLGRMVVQNFDEAFRTACGLPHVLCTFRETCGDVVVLEHEGSAFACDHFVDPEHLLGNLSQQSLGELLGHPALEAFGLQKREGLPGRCRACEVLPWCNGGCPKDRFLVEASGEPGVNYFCAGYRRFFRHSRPTLMRLAAHLKEGRPLGTFLKISGRHPGLPQS